MKTIIILLIIGLCLFIFWGKIEKLIVFFIKKNRKEPDEDMERLTLFSPSGVVRYVDITLEITEIGNGKATIAVIKKTKKSVKSEE